MTKSPTVKTTQPLTEHWCIKEGCKHGTLNGSIQLGFQYLQEFNSGYAQGFKDAKFDIHQKLDQSYCDCNYEPIRGVEAGRHLPSCRYGIVEDFLDTL